MKLWPIVHGILPIFLILPGIAVFISCGSGPDEAKEGGDKEYRESLLEVNKNLVKNEEQKIEDFIARYNWEMEETGTGLRYMIYREGQGRQAEKGEVAEIAFTVSLLNGEVCYSSAEEGSKSFLIGQGGVESGLEEGILLLREGDRAKFIIPSHLAFGLLGDMKKIPAKAVLVYDLELLKIK
jgi:FKBP-type peptidyl-prolyl cis-trans isomerase